MWPFRKKYPNIVKLTKEEEKVVSEYFGAGKEQAKRYKKYPKETGDKIGRAFLAQGLYQYSLRLITGDKPVSRENLQKALTSITKAYTVLPVPIFLYYWADALKELGRKQEALEKYKNFLEQQEQFQPDQWEKMFFNEHNINSAINFARMYVGDLVKT